MGHAELRSVGYGWRGIKKAKTLLTMLGNDYVKSTTPGKYCRQLQFGGYFYLVL